MASPNPTRRTFHTLDGMRGVAALLVFSLHAPAGVLPKFWDPLPCAHLAVDLFFGLSGFVVAEAYARRLEAGRLGAGGFVRLRVIRLWPLYLLGMALGLAALGDPAEGLGYDWQLALTAALALFMLPTPVTLGREGGLDWLFPANSAAWSLFWEMAINILYGATARRLTTPILLAAVAVGALAMAAQLGIAGATSEGWRWTYGWGGGARVLYAFPLGVLIHRHFAELVRLLRPAGGVPAWAVLLATGVVLAAPLPFPLLHLFEALIAMPLLVCLGAMAEPAAGWQRACTWLGTLSYALYALHIPLFIALGRLLRPLGYDPQAVTLWSPVVLVAVLGLPLLAHRYYDVPLRRWLMRRFGPKDPAGHAHGRAVALRPSATAPARADGPREGRK